MRMNELIESIAKLEISVFGWQKITLATIRRPVVLCDAFTYSGTRATEVGTPLSFLVHKQKTAVERV